MSEIARHNDAQRRYFEERAKPRMVPRSSPYLDRHVDALLDFAGLTPDDAILEVGAGMGRYTVPLLERGYRVEPLDLSRVLLDRLAGFAGCADLSLHACDIADPPGKLEGRFDAVVGFFTLHHLHELEPCFHGMRRVLRPGGRLVFLEPNPLNPLYYVQMLVTPGMSWEGDGGIVHMRPKPVVAALVAAGFSSPRVERMGFFPPFVVETRAGGRLERALDRVRLLDRVRPFQLFGAVTR